MPLSILSPSEAKKVRTCGYRFAKAEDALREGRPAFWDDHRYHQQSFCNAAVLANTHGLTVACWHVGSYAAQHDQDIPGAIGAFLDRLHPANPAAAGALIKARAEFCAAFESEAA